MTEAVVIPLWGKILLVSLAKKVNGLALPPASEIATDQRLDHCEVPKE